MKTSRAVVLAVVATTIATVFVMNLTTPGKKIEQPIVADYGVADAHFLRSMGNLLGPTLVGGNHVEALLNGDEIFPAMLAAIRAARRTITFETYIYWSGEIGRRFSDALCERARAGVTVYVLLDAVGGSKIDADLIEQMKAAGVQVERYNPLHWYSVSKINNRTHRKLLVVDGLVAFTGGVGIADEWSGNADSPQHWRDTHFRLRGPAVAQMQAAFNDNWLEVRGEVLHGADYFPALAAAGEAHAQVFNSSPREGSESVRLMYLLSIACARKSILIANAYLVPDDLSIDTFVAAAKRGVHIEIIMPGPVTDSQIVRKASRSRWQKLLEAGIELYEYQPTLFHCKVMIVDGLWCSVGSTNFDNRSFRLNDETNLNVYDAVFAKRQTEVFAEDRAQSRRVTLEEWQARPFSEKLGEWAAGLLRSQM